MLGRHVFRSKRNVLVLRNAASLRRYSSSTNVVGEEEFLRALAKVLHSSEWKPSPVIGLAISGGVDSMALATLYSRALRSRFQNLPRCHAIIVDHKVRPESTEEAKWVAQQLSSKFGINSSIVPLTWPENLDPHNTTTFEGAARRLRYQALGSVCRERNINSLLLAHHMDDQAETILSRIIKNRLRTGMQGMLPVERIPECFGIYGVHKSGNNEIVSRQALSRPATPFPFERGGISILRPLLGFEKDRLIATCEEQGVQWVEDKTNYDPTLTARNAIRHLTKTHKLPTTLGNAKLVHLSQRMQNRVSSLKETAEFCFNDCHIRFDIRTGSFHAQLPRQEQFLDRPIMTDNDKARARNVASLMLSRLLDIVSPNDSHSIGQFANGIDIIYPGLSSQDAHTNPTQFSVSGVLVRPWNKLSHNLQRDDALGNHRMDYLFFRQPPDSRQSAHLSVLVPPSSSVPAAEKDWLFFDGRYWIRVQNHTNSDLILRLLRNEDYDNLAKATYTRSPPKRLLKDLPFSRLHAALKLVQPPELRSQLPAIFRPSPDTGEDELIALPTLGIQLESPKSERKDKEEDEKPFCTWDIRYKEVDLGTRAHSKLARDTFTDANLKAAKKRLESEAFARYHRRKKVREKENKLVLEAPEAGKA